MTVIASGRNMRGVTNFFVQDMRKLGEAKFQFAQTQHQPREPVDREVIKVGVGGRIIRAKIVAIHGSHSGSTGTFEISAKQIEHNGNPPGHREADEDDF